MKIKLNQDGDDNLPTVPAPITPPPPIQHLCCVHLDNVNCQIEGSLPESFWEALSMAMSYEIPGAFFSAKYQKGFWDGRKKLLNKRYFAFPTGLFSLFREVARSHGVGYRVNDIRQKPGIGPALPLHGVTLRDYQQETIDIALQKQRGTVKAATGSGKTLILTGLTAVLNVETVIFTHKQDIFHQIVDSIRDVLKIPVGEIGCGKVYPQKVTVCMIQTAYRALGGDTKEIKDDEDNTVISKPEIIKQVFERARCIIVDECHRINSGMFSYVLSRCDSAFYRVGYSASPWREDNADLLIDAYTGPRCVDISASTLIKRGYLAKPTIYLYEFNHGRPTVRGYQTAYTDQVVKNVFRNMLVTKLVLKAAQDNKTCLVAVTRVEHGEILTAMLKEVLGDKVKFAHGSVDSEERKQILKDLDSKKLAAVVATTVFGEGVNVQSLDCIINAKAADSGVDSFQLVGRALRKTATKSKAIVVDIFDKHCKYLGSHSNSRHKIYKTEPEYTIIPVKDISQVHFV